MEKLLTAKEARELADTSNCQINRLVKEIEFAAKANRTTLFWSVYETSRVVVEKLITNLTSAGYTVSLCFSDETKPDFITDLQICW